MANAQADARIAPRCESNATGQSVGISRRSAPAAITNNLSTTKENIMSPLTRYELEKAGFTSSEIAQHKAKLEKLISPYEIQSVGQQLDLFVLRYRGLLTYLDGLERLCSLGPKLPDAGDFWMSPEAETAISEPTPQFIDISKELKDLRVLVSVLNPIRAVAFYALDLEDCDIELFHAGFKPKQVAKFVPLFQAYRTQRIYDESDHELLNQYEQLSVLLQSRLADLLARTSGLLTPKFEKDLKGFIKLVRTHGRSA